MKQLALFALSYVACACSHNEFDVSPDQVAKKLSSRSGPKGMPDLAHLPAGAVKHEYTYKKGDRLPDGSISDGDRKMVTVEIPKSAGGTGDRKFMTEDRTVKE